MQATILKQLYGPKGSVIPGALEGDEHLFVFLDLTKGCQALPHLMIGRDCEGRVENCVVGREAYDFEYYGPNPGARSKIRDKIVTEERAKLMEEYGMNSRPDSILELLQKTQEENARLKAQLDGEEDVNHEAGVEKIKFNDDVVPYHPKVDE